MKYLITYTTLEKLPPTEAVYFRSFTQIFDEKAPIRVLNEWVLRVSKGKADLRDAQIIPCNDYGTLVIPEEVEK